MLYKDSGVQYGMHAHNNEISFGQYGTTTRPRAGCPRRRCRRRAGTLRAASCGRGRPLRPALSAARRPPTRTAARSSSPAATAAARSSSGPRSPPTQSRYSTLTSTTGGQVYGRLKAGCVKTAAFTVDAYCVLIAEESAVQQPVVGSTISA